MLEEGATVKEGVTEDSKAGDEAAAGELTAGDGELTAGDGDLAADGASSAGGGELADDVDTTEDAAEFDRERTAGVAE